MAAGRIRGSARGRAGQSVRRTRRVWIQASAFGLASGREGGESGVPSEQGAGMTRREAMDGDEGGEIAEGVGAGRVRRGMAGADKVSHGRGESADFRDGAPGQRDGGEGRGRLGKRAAGAGEGRGADAGVRRELRNGAGWRIRDKGRGIEAELNGAEIAAGGIFALRDPMGGGQWAAVARPTTVVVDDGLVELGGGVGHASGPARLPCGVGAGRSGKRAGGREDADSFVERLPRRHEADEDASAEAEQAGDDESGEIGRESAEIPGGLGAAVSGGRVDELDARADEFGKVGRREV